MMKKETPKFQEGEIVSNPSGWLRKIYKIHYPEHMIDHSRKLMRVSYSYYPEALDEDIKPKGFLSLPIGFCSQAHLLNWIKGRT